MSLKLHELSPKIRARIESQIAAEDRALDKLQAHQPKPTPAPALVRCQPKPKPSECCVVVSLMRFGKRSLDSDNLTASFKPLRDAIAGWLRVDDADPRLSWQYGQQQTKGSEGVIVIIEEL